MIRAREDFKAEARPELLDNHQELESARPQARLRPNPSQQAVMECRDRLCVVAGAGSGKTGTLVESITLRLEESIGRQPELDITEVLALTFTDKAAAEMRLRLAQSFENRRQALKPGAGQAEFWRRQSARLDRADIGTIHSFALKILRENPLELGLTGAPALDESERDLKLDIEETVRDWLDEGLPELLEILKIYSLPALEEMLAKCAAALGSWGLGAFSADLSAREEDFGPAVLALREQVQAAQAELKAGAIKAQSNYYPKVMAAVNSLAGDLASTAVPAGNGMMKPPRPLPGRPGHLNAEISAASDPNWGIELSFSRWKKILDSGGDWYTKAGRALKKGIDEALSNMQARRDEQRALPLKRAFLSLTGRLSQALASAKKKRGAVNFDDILILARRLLARNPALRRRETGRRRLVVVDEFQDTNRLQADLLAYILLPPSDERIFPEDYPIWKEIDWSLASRNFMVFGDLKQSIYRFRGAEVEIMAGLNRRFQQGDGQVMALDSNYRSQAPLVDFFNRLFPARLGADFSALDLQRNQRPSLYPGPHVIHLTSELELRPRLSADRSEAQGLILANYLADLFSGRAGVLVPGESGPPRPPKPGDVAVIFRAFKRAPLFKKALVKAGWNCRLAAGDNPFEYSEVKALLATCQYLWGIDRELSLAAALRSPLGPVSDKALTLLTWPDKTRPILSDYFLKNRPWPHNLPAEDLLILESLKKLFNELEQLRGRLALVEIMERLVEERKLLPLSALENDGEDRVRAVTSFLALCRSAGQSRRGQKLGPVEELREMRNSWDPRRDGHQNGPAGECITLMTVHAAKGLEFPVVVVAEADRKDRRAGPAAVISTKGQLALKFVDEDGRSVKPADYQAIIEEEKTLDAREKNRLLYVASTRARDHLIFLGWDEPEKSEKQKKNNDETAEESWLGTILSCPEAAELIGRQEYAPNAQADEIPIERSDEAMSAQPAEAPPSLLEPMKLNSWALPVTSLGSFLARPESFFRENILGLDPSDEWVPGLPFFSPASPGPASVKKMSPSEAGTLFHAALENIDPLKPEIESAIKNESLRLGLVPAEAEFISMAHKLRSFLNHPLGLAWRASLKAGRQSWRELPFTMQLNGISNTLEKLSLKGVIDLFFETENGGGQIVDYKLARKPHEGPELIVYEYQLYIYAQALVSAGFKGQLTASLYFAGGNEAEIHQVILDQEFPISPLLDALQKRSEGHFDNRPLRTGWPATLNIVYFRII